MKIEPTSQYEEYISGKMIMEDIYLLRAQG